MIVVGIGWSYGGESGAWVVGERGSRTDKDTGGEDWEGCVGWPVDEKRCVKEEKELEACMEEEKMKDEGEN